MNYDFGTLRVEKVIIHDIPYHKAGDEGIAPVLSEVESELTQDLKNYFREKINGSVTSSTAYDVIFNPVTTSPIPKIVSDYITQSAKDFVATSHQITKHLFQIQTGINSKGLLAIVGCTLEGNHTIAILKLEREEGIRLVTTTIDGKQTFNLDLIRQLMLTGRTKLFKIGLFTQPGKTIDTVEGVICDYQRGYDPTSEVADFFLSKFLGCMLTLDPDVATKRFFQTSEQFINEEIPDSTCRGQYLTHLFSELTSQRGTINPRTFAEHNLGEAYRQKYLIYLKEHDTLTTVFDKDTKLIDSRIKLMNVQFQSGVSILAPNDVFQDRVKLTQLDTGDTRAEITDKVKRMGSKA